MAKLYSNKREPEVTAKIIKENEKYGTLLLEYLTGDNAGKTTDITRTTLKRWWSVAGEIEDEEPEEVVEEPKEPEFLTKVTPKPMKRKPKIEKINKQEKIDYLNILCDRYNLVSTAKPSHFDVLRIKRSAEDKVNYGELKINHTNFVLYTSRVIIIDESKVDCIIEKDSTGRAKIKFNLDDATMEYVIKQLSESEDKKNGKN